MANLTLEDIAELAGVSRSTVSRVVNDSPNVRAEVRQRVWEVIRKTGYHPNAAARSLASQRSWVLGLVLPKSVSAFFTDPYFPHLMRGIAQACNQYDYTMSLFLISNKEDEEKVYPRISRRGLLDGIVLQSGDIGDKLIERLVNSNIPLVIAGRPFQEAGVSYIDVDNVRAARKAVEHLINLGNQRIATIGGPDNGTVGIDRLHGYEQAIRNQGWEVDENLVILSDFTEQGGYQAMQELLPYQPDAVFAASDMMAVGAIRAVREAGLRVPEDIAFVGFDDLPINSISAPALTTIRQPVVEFGIVAVKTLLDVIEHGIEPVRRVILETELVVRETCGALLREQ